MWLCKIMLCLTYDANWFFHELNSPPKTLIFAAAAGTPNANEIFNSKKHNQENLLRREGPFKEILQSDENLPPKRELGVPKKSIP